MTGEPPSAAEAMARAGTAVFGDGQPPTATTPWRGTFREPRSVDAAYRVEDVEAVVTRAEAAAGSGAWVVLVLAYEAAPAADAALVAADPGPSPLAWAAAYDAPDDTQKDVRTVSVADDPAAAPDVAWTPSLDAASFAARLDQVQTHIAAGDTYQVNLTFPLHGELRVPEAWPWFAAARRRAEVPYAAWVARVDDIVMSLSPELFFDRHGQAIGTRPMKGTQPRGRWLAEDEAAAATLASSAKARAENVMIVDLLRNDLGRLALPGSVRVDALCRVERYPTVWQMTSTITASLPAGCSLWRVLQALFPCGSVTGAPKVRTMAIIADLERLPRGVYTGAIGLLSPDGGATFSVPIRTAVLDRGSGRVTLGVGAGITADSDAGDEYAECLLKASVARRSAAGAVTGLFETIRLEDGACWLREGHLRRLAESATFFGLPYDAEATAAALGACEAAHPLGLWRVRLVLHADGSLAVQAAPYVPEPPRTWRVGLAAQPVAAGDLRLFHKTLDRQPYETARATRPDCDDVLLWTAEGGVTESTIANLVVELAGRRWTPPIGAGLLPGVFRDELLRRGEIGERMLTPADLAVAPRLWLVNSLRGWMVATLV